MAVATRTYTCVECLRDFEMTGPGRTPKRCPEHRAPRPSSLEVMERREADVRRRLQRAENDRRALARAQAGLLAAREELRVQRRTREQERREVEELREALGQLRDRLPKLREGEVDEPRAAFAQAVSGVARARGQVALVEALAEVERVAGGWARRLR